MNSKILTTNAPNRAESVGVKYPQGFRVCLHEGNMIAAVQKRIWLTHGGRLSVFHPATPTALWGVQSTLSNVEVV